ncbi:MAG: hypothetical protein HY553_22235 [Elusimicrobia bacterium]|nr:hypothetical protein [Elusimicrobiota bacterium]
MAFRRVYVLAAALAFPGGALALSGSKLGPHVLGDSQDGAALMLQDACPRVAKWLANSGAVRAIRRYRERCPGGQVVVRVYVPQSVKYGLSTEPESAAADFFRRIHPALVETPPSLVDWVEGVNELDNVEDWYHNGAAASWFAAFSSRLADLIHAAGYDPLLGSIAVGNPALEGEQLFGRGGAMRELAEVIKSKPYKVGWSYHAYGNQLFNPDDQKYWALRYRLIRDQAGLHGVPIVLTEGGQDGPRGGWQGRSDADTYTSWLRWLDGELRKDAEVVGVTLFQVGQRADWAKFDLEPIAERLAAYLRSEREGPVVPPPPPSPPPPPQRPAALRANDGQSFASQDEGTKGAFEAYWGAQGFDAEKRWLGEHNMDLIDGDWREKVARGEAVPNDAVGCFDAPYSAPAGFRWTALCAQACTTNANCPAGVGGQSGWCFGFPGSSRCLRFDAESALGRAFQ